MALRVWSAVVLAVVLSGGVCVDWELGRQARASAAHPPTPVSRGPNTTRTFADPLSGITLGYPATWQREPAKTAELAVAAPPGPRCGCASLMLDVPAMSWHPPFIPITVVASRYVDALRQTGDADAAVQQSADLTVAGATARRVTTRGHVGGGVRVDTAVVMVHCGQVYILSCDSDDAGLTLATRALDAAVASVRWTK